MKISNLMVLLLVPVLLARAGAVPLHPPGAVVSTRSQFSPFESDSDSDLTYASASILLPDGGNGSASARYNGAVQIRADSSTDGGGPGNSIVSDATQVTIFRITSASVPPDTLVTGSVNLALHGRILNIGNNSYGGGEIALRVDLHQGMPGLDESRIMFNGSLYWNMGSSVTPLTYTGFENFGSIDPSVGTGNPFLDFGYSTSVTFQGYVGDEISVEYKLHALSGGTTRVNFSNTGTYGVSFDNPAVSAEVVPSVTPSDDPTLTIVVGDDAAQLTWEGGPGIKLQRSPTLAPSSWLDVVGSEGLSTMEVPVGDGREFFRLVIP